LLPIKEFLAQPFLLLLQAEIAILVVSAAEGEFETGFRDEGQTKGILSLQE
jgi:translation elongation factor EF-1alpha